MVTKKKTTKKSNREKSRKATKKAAPAKKTKKSTSNLERDLLKEVAREFESLKNVNVDSDNELRRQLESLRAGHESTKILSSKLIDQIGVVKDAFDNLDEHHLIKGAHEHLKKHEGLLKELKAELAKLGLDVRFEHENMKKLLKGENNTPKDVDKKSKELETHFVSKKRFDAYEKSLAAIKLHVADLEETLYETIDVQAALHDKLSDTNHRLKSLFELMEVLAKKVVK